MIKLMPGLGARQDLDALYRNSFVCVIPSLRKSFGQTVIESFIYKTAVIAANSGALPEIIKHRENGLLFTSNSHDELVERIQNIVDDSSLRNKLVENALLDAEKNYDSERMVKDYLELYDRVIKKRPLSAAHVLKPHLRDFKTLSAHIIA